ncbi:MAG: hypothetical protein H6810_09675 [Phycisphaeraceae bacterium]|nr:MAG: hypothetical protein H6810_09675 [Phycisphaeraceae bacterium]
MTYVRGTKKNIFLTIWLALPFLFLIGIVVGIFAAYSNGPIMAARPVGEGAGDTGGANALGEWLAGHDPDQIERLKRDIREGRLVDPLDWAVGVSLRLTPQPEKDPPRCVLLWSGEGSRVPIGVRPLEPIGDGRVGLVLSKADIDMIYAEGRPGAGLYLADEPDARPDGDRLLDAAGAVLTELNLPPVDAGLAVQGEPIPVAIMLPQDSGNVP